MTKEQKLFKIGLRKLDRYDEIRKVRELTYAEETEENKIKEVLFGSVRNYGIDLAHKMTQKYKLPNDCFYDLCQDLAIIFYEKYRLYNPEQTTPCTYFVRYFKQVISSYLTKNIHKLSQYDTNNLLKVRKEINYYESKGIAWTEEMLSIRTGLSSKVVHSTLIYGYASNYAQIDEAYDLKAHIKTPEEAYAEKESHETLLEALKNNSSPEELNLLLMRINAEGIKEMPYETIARNVDMPVREVKRRINSCICKLNQDQAMMEHFAKRTVSTYKNTLVLQDNTTPLLDEQLDDFLTALENV